MPLDTLISDRVLIRTIGGPAERLLRIVESNDPVVALTVRSIDMSNSAFRSTIGLPYLFFSDMEKRRLLRRFDEIAGRGYQEQLVRPTLNRARQNKRRPGVAAVF